RRIVGHRNRGSSSCRIARRRFGERRRVGPPLAAHAARGRESAHTLSLAAALALAAVPAVAQSRDGGAADDYIRQPIRIDKTFNQSLQGGCKYTVSVSGTITPVPSQAREQPPLVAPHLDVSAQANCPNTASV